MEIEKDENIELGDLQDVSPKCLNCDADLNGDFCSDCGQSVSVRRYRLGTLLADIYRELRKVDLAVTVQTAWELFVRPGQFVRGYLAGKRVGFINPVKFFFYAFVADTTVRTALVYLTADKSISNLISSDVSFQFVDLIATVFWGFLIWVFYRNDDLNVAECAVAALLFQAEINFISTAATVLLLPFREIGGAFQSLGTAIDSAVTLGYGYFFAYQLFSGSKATIVIKQTILFVVFAILVLALYLLQYLVRAYWTASVSG